jgi:hypothetical protein
MFFKDFLTDCNGFSLVVEIILYTRFNDLEQFFSFKFSLLFLAEGNECKSLFERILDKNNALGIPVISVFISTLFLIIIVCRFESRSNGAKGIESRKRNKGR